ncbi:MAG: hypothetical protein ABIU55_02415 [Ferruginibacter sp.]
MKESVLGSSFRLKTDFGNDTSLGYHFVGNAQGFDQMVLSFQLQKNIEFKKFKHSAFLLFYGFGAGVGFNRTQNYYDSSLSDYSFQRDNIYNYVKYRTSFRRRGAGIFICPSIGAEWLNGKGKTILISELYADLGLAKMLHINVDYEYGTYTNPPKTRHVPNQELNAAGSTIGLKIGVPIRLLNFSKR